MVYQGTVQNGVIVFLNGVQPPEGSQVRIEIIQSVAPQEPLSPQDELLLQMPELAVDTGIPDLATNLDHYLYGHPKVGDGQ